MKHALIASAGLFLICLLICPSGFAQSAEEPASKDDVILYLRTMHSHDMIQKLMAVQAQSMEQLMHSQFKDKGALPADFEPHLKKALEDLIKNMPFDEIVDAMIPAYQKHFTHGDIEAMNAFYSSPVGQKVLEELPAVTQEGVQAAMPIFTKYLKEWQEQMQHELAPAKKPAPSGAGDSSPQN